MNDKVENNETDEQADEIAAQNERVVMPDRRLVPEVISSVTDSRRLFQHVRIGGNDEIILTTWGTGKGTVTSHIAFSYGGLDLLKELLGA